MSDADTFRRLYLCEPAQPSEGYRCAYALWCVAFALMEREDRKWCTATGHGGEALPATWWERKRVNETGRAMYRTLKRLAELFHGNDWSQAKEAASRLSIAGWERVADENPCVVEEVRTWMGPIERRFE